MEPSQRLGVKQRQAVPLLKKQKQTKYIACADEEWWMHRECVVVNGMSVMRRRGQTKQLHREAYHLANTLTPQQSLVYVIILENEK